MTRIKICGIRRMEDVAYVNECYPDYIGFVFAESRRQVLPHEAMKLREKLNSEIKPVGVFVNEDVTKVAELMNSGIIDVAQLHGNEDSKYVKKLRDLMNHGEIIKAVRVEKQRILSEGILDECSADFLLFDTFIPGEQGGTGESFDWSVLKYIKKKYFLAGGIGIHNVESAIKMLNPFAVDLSSAVEANGYKDRESILNIVKCVRGVHNNE